MRKENTRWSTPKQACSQISTNENEKDEGGKKKKIYMKNESVGGNKTESSFSSYI